MGNTRRYYDSGFAFFGLGVNVNEAIIRKLSLSLENISESDAKAIATQHS